MAAYLAGRRGTRRDALLIGATVTATHTTGVLVLGLVVSVSASVAPDGVLSWLGVLSGLLVAGIGVMLLASAARAWRVGRRDPAVAAQRVLVTVGHGHGQESPARFGRGALVGLGVAGGLVPSPTALLVLLGAIGLGRTWFGVGLVLSYGFGMAGTLTAAGLLLVGLRDRLNRVTFSDRLPASRPGWSPRARR
jgi:ABC-type nickel/cobalt efflux system permease component RcnA